MEDNRQKLHQAYGMIKAGQKQQALEILYPIIKSDPYEPDAWWLLANAASDPAEIRRALRKVLELRPGDAPARQMLDSINRQNPADNEFSFDDGELSYDDLQTSYSTSGKPKRSSSPVSVGTEKKGTSPIVIILAAVGVVSLIICGACFIITAQGAVMIGQVVQEVMETVTFMPANVTNFNAQLAGNANHRGTVELGQKLRAVVSSSQDDSWTFNGTQGAQITIEVKAIDTSLDPMAALYNPAGRLLAANDDIVMGINPNSRIVFTLPTTGAYTIVVRAYDSGGEYELSVVR